MFLEILIVGVIMSILYMTGLVGFGSTAGIVLSLAILVVVGTLSFLGVNFFARRAVDSLFGFDAWAPRSRPLAVAGGKSASLEALEKLVSEVPKDAEVSRTLADMYLRAGRIDDFVKEKRRMLATGALTVQESATIHNRLADIELERRRPEVALALLKSFCEQHPRTAEAFNARKRCEVIMATADEVRAGKDAE